MKPTPVSHESYQNFILLNLQKYFSGSLLVIVRADWLVIYKLWITDLSYVSTWLIDSYSTKGPAPRDPSSMMRSYLLFLLTNPTIGITKWVDMLHRVPLYAILSGFTPGDIPGVGTFYDFFSRIWGFQMPNTQPKIKQKRKKKKKKKKPKKGEKSPAKTGIIRKLVDRFFKYGSKRKVLPADKLFDFFQSQFLTISSELGLLGNPNNFTVAGDLAAIETARYPRSKPTCECYSLGITKCDHPRVFSQPDCNSGWDSSREKFFNGYHLYMLSASASYYDLPLYPRLNPASRHDSISLLASLDEFLQRSTLPAIDRILLDSAHDAMAIYELLKHLSIEPFIDLNPRTKHNLSTACDIQISPKGVPICSSNLEMKSNGFDKSQNRIKWRCPLASGTKNTCSNPCATFGRTFHTFNEDNLRLFPTTPRSSKKWKDIYKRRSSVERSNKREKIDYHLEDGATALLKCGLYLLL
ncbi:MAG: transposase [Alkaliphilus sp.]